MNWGISKCSAHNAWQYSSRPEFMEWYLALRNGLSIRLQLWKWVNDTWTQRQKLIVFVVCAVRTWTNSSLEVTHFPLKFEMRGMGESQSRPRRRASWRRIRTISSDSWRRGEWNGALTWRGTTFLTPYVFERFLAISKALESPLRTT